MPVAAIGAWEFFVPDGWDVKDKDVGVGVSYLEAPDGTKGMYVKCIELSEPLATARDLANYIQHTQEASFGQLDGSNWGVIERRDRAEGLLQMSALDMLDSEASYRVLSLVVCDAREAIQLTLHDYVCEDYEATKECFAETEKSIEKVGHAA